MWVEKARLRFGKKDWIQTIAINDTTKLYKLPFSEKTSAKDVEPATYANYKLDLWSNNEEAMKAMKGIQEGDTYEITLVHTTKNVKNKDDLWQTFNEYKIITMSKFDWDNPKQVQEEKVSAWDAFDINEETPF